MSGTHGLLQPNQPGYYYITLEESYVTLFKISAEKWFKLHKNEEDAEKNRNARLAHAVAKAFITDVLVHLSNELYKTTKSEKNLWVFLSFPELESRLHGAVKIRTLKDAMKEMIEDGYVFKRPNRDPRYKSLEYCVNLPKYRKELNSLPAKKDSANLHDENDSAKMHDLSANLHDDDANLHDDSANPHAIHNIDITKTKQRESMNASAQKMTTPEQKPSTPSSTPSSLSSVSSQEKQETPSPKEEQLSSEENRIQGYWCKAGNLKRPSAKKHWSTLSEHIKTFEDFESLFKYTQNALKGKKDERVYPGNLVDHLEGWKQKQARAKQAAEPKPQAPKPYVRDLAAEHKKMVAEMQTKIAASSKK